jgi:hypothetical protein
MGLKQLKEFIRVLYQQIVPVSKAENAGISYRDRKCVCYREKVADGSSGIVGNRKRGRGAGRRRRGVGGGGEGAEGGHYLNIFQGVQK